MATIAFHPHFTPREDQVLELIGQGLTNKEIGSELGVAEKTVKNIATMVFAKLGVRRRAQAAVYITLRHLSDMPSPHSGPSRPARRGTPASWSGGRPEGHPANRSRLPR